jgi:hypothetical protein
MVVVIYLAVIVGRRSDYFRFKRLSGALSNALEIPKKVARKQLLDLFSLLFLHH